VSAVSARNSRSVEILWPPRRSTSGDAALWVAVGIGVAALAALATAATREPGMAMVLWAVAALVLTLIAVGGGLWALAYRRLTYALTATALEIEWLGHVTGVPYTAVDGIYTGQRLVGNATPTVPVWPGIYVGPGRARGIGRLRFFATSPDPAALTLITLEQGGVVVSARNPHDFRLALIERIKDTGDKPSVSRLTYRPPTAVPWSALFDPWFGAAIGAGLVLLLCMLVAIGLGFEALPADIPMRFDASGDPSQIAPRGDLLRLPLIGLLVLLVDSALGIWLHARDRLVARLLWLGGAVLEGVVLVAIVRLLA
jgi:hypothetical protein